MVTSMKSHGIVAQYLRWMRAVHRADSYISSTYSVLHRLADITGKNLLEVTPEDLHDWQVARSRWLGPDTLASQIGIISGFYRWAVDTQGLAQRPDTHLEKPRRRRRSPRPVPDADLRRALDAADDQMRAVLTLAAMAGLRACEIASLDWSSVDIDSEEPYLIPHGKGGHEERVPIAPAVVEALEALQWRRGPVIRRADGTPGYVSANRMSQMVSQHFKTIGMTHTCHKLRHRYASAVYGETGDLRATQELMRHASPTTTAIYARATSAAVRRGVEAAGKIRPGRKT